MTIFSDRNIDGQVILWMETEWGGDRIVSGWVVMWVAMLLELELGPI